MLDEPDADAHIDVEATLSFKCTVPPNPGHAGFHSLWAYGSCRWQLRQKGGAKN